MTKRLAGRVAVITGASSGIGEATALALAGAGARVALVARRRERLDEVAARIIAAGGEAQVIEADLGRLEEAARIVRDAEAHFGRVDILINNAGVMYLEPVISADMERWRRMYELNVLALMASTQAALPGMQQRRDGHIVNISSTAGRTANPTGAGYSATKFGVVAFSEALRREVFSHNVRVTVIEPGLVATELREHIADAQVQKTINAWADSVRQLQGEDVANAILYAVSQPDHVCINEILMRPTDQER